MVENLPYTVVLNKVALAGLQAWTIIRYVRYSTELLNYIQDNIWVTVGFVTNLKNREAL